MSELRSALEGFRAEDLRGVPDAALEEDFAELQRASEVIEAERLRRLGEIDRRRTWAGAGFVSTTSWLVSRFRLAASHASRAVRMCRSLRGMPAGAAAYADGDISSSAVALLAHARDSASETFAEHEQTLVEAARSLSFDQLRKVIGYWRQAADREGLERDAERQHARRRLHVSRTVFGMVRLDGDLDPEGGETLLAAIRSIVDAETRRGDPDDHRTPAQRRADALVELARGHLDSGERPSVGGERPHVSMIVDLQTLRDDSDGTIELGEAGPVLAEVARRIACDASVSRVVMRGPSEVLDVGRRTNVVPAGLRRALIVRDRGCRAAGCDRPAGWCDAHHVRHWSRGGPTSLENLVLLCRRHHRAVHHGKLRLSVEPDRAPP